MSLHNELAAQTTISLDALRDEMKALGLDDEGLETQRIDLSALTGVLLKVVIPLIGKQRDAILRLAQEIDSLRGI